MVDAADGKPGYDAMLLYTIMPSGVALAGVGFNISGANNTYWKTGNSFKIALQTDIMPSLSASMSKVTGRSRLLSAANDLAQHVGFMGTWTVPANAGPAQNLTALTYWTNDLFDSWGVPAT